MRRQNLLLALGSTVLALGLGEAWLRLAGIPVEHPPHQRDPQFTPVRGAEFVYVNVPNAAIRFTYDGNPRGYFEPGNVVVHHTNAEGFRGKAFSMRKPENTVRVLFLGDSFTFGEGVKDEDTFAARFEALVSARGLFPGKTLEVINLGVGGYNTEQEAALLRTFGVHLAPDYVYVDFCLNDAEPLLFAAAPGGGLARRRRGTEVAEEGTGTVPAPWTALRLTRLLWLAAHRPLETRHTLAHYRALYEPDAAGWSSVRAGLESIARVCRERGVPARVVLLPLLFRLPRYPFLDLNRRVCDEAGRLGMECVDLLPAFAGLSGPELWVDPSDQHPNEEAHRRIAEYLAAQFRP